MSTETQGTDQPASPSATGVSGPAGRLRWGLMLGALGVVFGDIGTSPLYAVRECFRPQIGTAPSPENVLGILSLIFWALTLVVTVKYLWMVLRADNDGEGGVLALLTRVISYPAGHRQFLGRRVALVLGLVGASLLAADGMLTPAISVLSAVEGMDLAVPVLKPYVVPITVCILVALFAVQRHGTGRIGWFFGPIMLVWFCAIALLGIAWIVRMPRVLLALNPLCAGRFFANNGWHGLLVFGAVILCVTGCEALYADMGHFGRPPLVRAWLWVVFPAVVLNYFGQGACVIAQGGKAIENLFYELVPSPFLLPMLLLATIATVIASQALISGMFSLARQAVLLDIVPRMNIVHTSPDIEGRIYVPLVNGILGIATVGLVLGFKHSSGLAGAYGMAVIGDMLITTLLLAAVQFEQWHWPLWRVLGVSGALFLVEIAFLAGNAPKIRTGAWFPLVAGLGVFLVLTTWRRGKKILSLRVKADGLTLDDIVRQLTAEPIHRVPGTALFMVHPRSVPRALLHHVKHNKVLHERVLLLSVVTEEVPSVPEARQVAIEEMTGGFTRIVARCGFMQSVNVPHLLRLAEFRGLKLPKGEISYYVGRLTLRPTGRSKMWAWQKRLFAFLFHNERSPADHFGLPLNRVIELGQQAEI